MVLLSLAAVGAVLTVAPDLSTSLAQAVGVGRGVDLVIYLALVCLFFLCLVLQAQVRQLQESLTELARALALSNANEAAAEQGSPGEPAGGTSA